MLLLRMLIIFMWLLKERKYYNSFTFHFFGWPNFPPYGQCENFGCIINENCDYLI